MYCVLCLYLLTGDAVVGVGGGWVVCGAVQRLLRRWAVADAGAVQITGMLKHRGAEGHLSHRCHRLPSVCRLVVRGKLGQMRFWGKEEETLDVRLCKVSRTYWTINSVLISIHGYPQTSEDFEVMFNNMIWLLTLEEWTCPLTKVETKASEKQAVQQCYPCCNL